MARQSSETPCEILVRIRAVTEREITRVVSNTQSVPFLNLRYVDLDTGVAQLIPETLSRLHQLIGISRVGRKITVATGDPLNSAGQDEVARATHLIVKPVLAAPADIARVIEMIPWSGTGRERIRLDPSIPPSPSFARSIARSIISGARTSRAREIQIEPTPQGARVLHRRRDGVEFASTLDKASYAGLIHWATSQRPRPSLTHGLHHRGPVALMVANDVVRVRLWLVPSPGGDLLRIELDRDPSTS